jgi:O-antigen/teichoic acid export membrane protein
LSAHKGSLKQRAMRAGAWATLMAAAGTIFRFGSSLIMTRLLVPEVFGVVGLSGAVYMIVSLLSDIGLRQCVIYSDRGDEQSFLDTVWSFTTGIGLFIATVTCAVAFAIYWGAVHEWFAPQSVYTHPDLPWVLAATGLSSVVVGLKSPKVLVLERHLDLKRVGYIELIPQVVAAVVTIALTWQWRSVWGIVAGTYAGCFTTVLMSIFWVPGPIGRLGWDRQCAREIVNYGRWIWLSSFAFVVAINADRLLLGVWLTPAFLGFYGLALNIVSSVETIVTRPFAAVGMPAFSELSRRGSGDLKKAFQRFRLPFDLTTIAFAGLIFAAGQLMVDVLYDERYAAAGRTLQILSFSLMFPRLGVISTVHAAIGHPQTGSWSSVIKLVSVLVLIPLGHALGGYEGVMWAIALNMIPSSLFLYWRNQKFKLNDLMFEAKVLLVWPIGFGVGWLGVLIGRPVLHYLGWV